MKEIILGIWLGIQGVMDFKYKEIPLWFTLLGGVVGIVICVREERTVFEVLVSCLPGLVVIFFSWMTKEIIGFGDGIVLLVMGFYLSLSQVLSVGMFAVFIAGIVALILLTVFQKGGSYRIPFIPFLTLAYGIDYLIRIGENMR
ncbi:MAG: prepilin peptidase [Agathobacter sp.]|nr:prepilin peptidase [Agathobacter sp.]